MDIIGISGHDLIRNEYLAKKLAGKWRNSEIFEFSLPYIKIVMEIIKSAFPDMDVNNKLVKLWIEERRVLYLGNVPLDLFKMFQKIQNQCMNKDFIPAFEEWLLREKVERELGKKIIIPDVTSEQRSQFIRENGGAIVHLVNKDKEEKPFLKIESKDIVVEYNGERDKIKEIANDLYRSMVYS